MNELDREIKKAKEMVVKIHYDLAEAQMFLESSDLSLACMLIENAKKELQEMCKTKNCKGDKTQ